MKSLIRWGAALGLAGGIFLSPLISIGGSIRALALTNEQVVERLQVVPVFTFLDGDRNFLVTRANNAEADALPVVYMFISQQAAQSFLDQLKQRNPDQANGFSVTPVPLSLAYEMARRDQNQENPVQVAFIPAQQQVEAARTILQAQGGNAAQEFRGVPLFIAKSSTEEGVYLTTQANNQEFIPVYFSREDVQGMIDRLRQSQPDLASRVEIQVINLEGLIQNLQSSENEALNQIILMPSAETRQFIQTVRQSEGQQPAQGQNPNRQNRNRQNRNRQQAPQAQPQQPARPQQ